MGKKKYYGPETEKAVVNFPITNTKVSLSFIYALADVKKASCIANFTLKKISKAVYKSIMRALDEILDGKFDDQFLTDSIQGGAGTSINMNINEVAAARACEILSGKIKVNPLAHVNLSQSTNDVLPTALRLLILREIDEYVFLLNKLRKTFERKSKKFIKVFKVGRTHLQDAVPISLSQEFSSYGSFVKRDIERLTEIKKYLLRTNLGGTAVGTGIGSSKEYKKLANENLSKITGHKFSPSDDLIDATQNTDTFLHVSFLLAVSASGLSKICSDLRLMASGPRAGFGEIILPRLQVGSSIMPGKNNPVILEMMNQIANIVVGNSVAGAFTNMSGQLELNVGFPLYVKTITENFQILKNGVTKLTEFVEKIEANEKRCRELLDKSLASATVLSGQLEYEKTAEIVHKAIKNNSSLMEILKREKLMTKEIEKALGPKHMVNPPD